MAPPTTVQDTHDDWDPVARVFARPELCAIIAGKSGLVGAWRLKGVSRAFREGATEWLLTLPGLLVCGGVKRVQGMVYVTTDEVWRLNLAELRWERMPSLTQSRHSHACCAVRGDVVVLGGCIRGQDGPIVQQTASVEILGCELLNPPLSRGTISGAAAVAMNESKSDQGQVLMIGGYSQNDGWTAAVHKVDLATGACTAQPSLLVSQLLFPESVMAARLPDGRIVCARSCYNYSGGTYTMVTQVLEPPQSEPGMPNDASWRWRHLPATSVGHCDGQGCVLSDGRFAVFGGRGLLRVSFRSSPTTAKCEVLTLDGDIERWDPCTFETKFNSLL